MAQGQASARARRGAGADGLPLDRKDLRWLVKLTHPDRNDGDPRATRVTQWLNDLLRTARDREKGD
jgi:hypothetical protein